jgi:hypothetical protein
MTSSALLSNLEALLSYEELPKDWASEMTLYEGIADDRWPGVNHRRVFESKASRAE